MKVDEVLVDRLSNLSRLHFDEKEKQGIKADLSTILDFVGKLQEVNVEGVEPLIHINERTNVLRPDKAETTISHEEALLNAPDADSDYFKVPKVLKK